MSRNYLAILLFCAGLTQQSMASWLPEKINNILTRSSVGFASLSSLVSTDFQFRFLGSQNVSSALEDSMRAILVELGLQQKNIAIKQMSDRLAQVIGRANALATANAIYVDEAFMQSLSFEQQRALIGHEGIHIKDNHLLLRLIVVSLGFVGYASIQSMLPEVNNTKDLMQWAGGTAGSFTAFALGLSAYARFLEKSADQQSVQILQCHNGARALCHHTQAQEENGSVFAKLKSWVADKFATHPSSDERCAYLSANL